MSRHIVIIPLIFGCLSPATLSADVVDYDLIPVDSSVVYPGDDPAVPDFNDGSYYTFDLVGTIQIPHSDDVWVAANVESTLDGPGTFFLHPQGSDIQSEPALVEQYPALGFDTYFTTMSGSPPWFAPDYPAYSGPGDGTITEIECQWQETYYEPDGYPEGAYTLARFTVQPLTAQPITVTVTGEGWDSTGSGGSWPFGPFVVTVPEPRGVLLLGVVALLLSCRRW